MNKRFLAYILSVFLSLSVFSLYRLVFFLSYRNIFALDSFQEVLSAFLLGLLFDLHITSVFLLGPYLLLHLPLPWSRMPNLARLIHWFSFPFLVLSILVMTVDVYYYQEAGRRLSNEVFALGNDVRETIAMMVEYRLGIFFFVVVSALAFLGWRAISRKVLVKGEDPTFRRGILFLLLFLFVAGLSVRGSLGRSPIHTSSAFILGRTELGHLALNPVFTVAKSFIDGELAPLGYLSDDDAIRNVQETLGIEGEQLPDAYYPVLRANQGASTSPVRPNIVILIVESFSSKHLGIQGSQFGVTPNFDRLARQGLFFNNFYSVGVRTSEGLTAITLGLPALNQMVNKTKGSALSGFLTQNHYRGIAAILGEHGYRSLFMQGGKAESFRLIELSKLTGFDRYLAMEDFPFSAEDRESVWGVWDHVMLARLKETMAGTPEPFLAVWLSITNHPPYNLPADFVRPISEEHPNHALLNSISYTDQSLGSFFKSIENEPFFKRTIFLVLADHASRSIDTFSDRFHIPLLIYGPGMIEPAFTEKLGSQVDLIPTVMDLAGVSGLHHAMGLSLLEDGPVRFAPVNLGQGFGWMEDRRFLSIDSEGGLVSVYDFNQNAHLETRGVDLTRPLSYFQVANNLLYDNRLAPRQVTRGQGTTGAVGTD